MPDLSPTETTAFQSLLASLCPNLALALAEQINHEIVLEDPAITAVPIETFTRSSADVVQTTFNLNAPSAIDNLFLFSVELGNLFADLIAGNDGSAPSAELSSAELDALSTAMTGMVRGLATALTNLTGDSVDMESSLTVIGPISLPPTFALEESAVQAKVSLTLPDLLDSEMTMLFTPEFVRALVGDSADADPDAISLDRDDMGDTEEFGFGSSASNLIQEDELAAMLGGLSEDIDTTPTPSFSTPAAAPAPSGLPFGNFPPAPQDNLPRGLELIMDIPLDVTVELGRVRMLIKDVLELASGSIVELDRVAGEPVDLLVNGRLVAKGEVVVIEDNFGIRITEIISPADRVAGLGRNR